MAKKFKDLTKDFSDVRMKRVEAKTKEILRSIDLQELRNALELTQIELAKKLRISQTAISKMESNSDMFISTLNRILVAMGGQLKIIAKFPDKEIEINQFKEIEDSKYAAAE